MKKIKILYVGLSLLAVGGSVLHAGTAVAEERTIPAAALSFDKLNDYEGSVYKVEMTFSYTNLRTGDTVTESATEEILMHYAYKGINGDMVVGSSQRFQWFLKDAQVHESGSGLTFGTTGVSVNNREYAIGSQHAETTFHPQGNWTYTYTGGGISAAKDFAYDFSISMTNQKEDTGAEAASIVNVKAFGAAGDGVTDDTQAFKKAIAACAETGAQKLVVPACEAFYNITEALIFTPDHNYLEVEGNGAEGPIHLTSYTRDGAGHLIGVIGSSEEEMVEGFQMRNLELNVTYVRPSSMASTAAADNALGCSYVKDSVFDGITVKQSPWKGVTGQVMCQNVTFRNMNVSGCYKYGIGFEGHTVEDVEILDSTAHHNKESGIYVGAGSDKGYLINDVTIEDCTTYSNTYDGISLSQCSNAQISDSLSYGNSAAGVKAAASENIVLMDCEMIENETMGVYILGGSNNLVENCIGVNNNERETSPRGNFVTMNSPNGEFSNCQGDQGQQAFTNWSENTLVTNCLF